MQLLKIQRWHGALRDVSIHINKENSATLYGDNNMSGIMLPCGEAHSPPKQKLGNLEHLEVNEKNGMRSETTSHEKTFSQIGKFNFSEEKTQWQLRVMGQRKGI